MELVGGQHTAARKTAALGAGAVGGVALFAVALPQLASTFNPTKLGTALLTVTAALVTAAGDRWVQLYRQRKALETAVRAWPPERLRAHDPATLGVYPPRDRDGNPQPYRPRAEDAELDQALAGDAPIVVVDGPAGGGKSRAAAEAARRKLPVVPAIVPVDAAALATLADSGVRLNGRESCLCLWLDGLDRFIEVLDPRMLGALQGIAPDTKVVATVRTERWRELLGGTGQASESARALDDAATTVELGPLPPSPAPTPSAAAPERANGPPVVGPPWRDAWLGCLCALLLGLGVLAAIFASEDALTQPPPLSDQMNKVKAEALRGDGAGRRHVVLDERVRLHPAEADSWILVLEDRPSHDAFYAGAANGVGPPPHSNELRIYDVRGGRLHLALRFRPPGVGRTAAEWRELNARPLGKDYDLDGSNEVIAGYAIAGQATEALVPFAIDWEDGRYKLVALTPDKPRLATRGLRRQDVRFRREAYQQRLVFANAVGDRPFRAPWLRRPPGPELRPGRDPAPAPADGILHPTARVRQAADPRAPRQPAPGREPSAGAVHADVLRLPGPAAGAGRDRAARPHCRRGPDRGMARRRPQVGHARARDRAQALTGRPFHRTWQRGATLANRSFASSCRHRSRPGRHGRSAPSVGRCGTGGWRQLLGHECPERAHRDDRRAQ